MTDKKVIHSKDVIDSSVIDNDIEKYLVEEDNYLEDKKEETIEEDGIDKSEGQEEIFVEEYNLDTKYVHSISGVSELKPMVVYMKVGDKIKIEKEVGVPGYYDDHSQTFFLLNGQPLDAINFKERFSHFLNSISTDMDDIKTD